MKKLRKRIFVAVLVALMMVTAMPATALYASAETVSDNAIEQAGTEDTEETVDGDTEETETDGAGETVDGDTEEPAQEPPTGPLEEDTARCICETLCTEDGINGDCPVCGAEGADLSACKGKEQGSAPETDTEDDNADTDTAECICETLCMEDSINGDCPVCGADDASLLDCKGKVSEENTENQEDTGICKHHQEHDADCGYISKSEDGEGSPCTYECRICPVEDLIAALPEQVTEDNADDVRGQLDHILDLYRELNEDEQAQIDLSRCYELQEALDNANAPMTVAEEINISQTLKNILTAEDSGCPGHTFTGTAETGVMIYVESGVHNVTFSGLNITASAMVGVAPGAAMNLTIEGTNTISAATHCAGIYVPVGATLVINGTGSLNVSGNGGGAGIGGATYAPDEDGSDGDPNCGTVVINGGTITAAGGGTNSASAGIGGGTTDDAPGNGGNVTINGGTVTATGGSDGYYGGAGIGGAGGLLNERNELVSGNGGTLTINGGTVNLTAGTHDLQYPAYGFGRGSCDPDTSTGTCELTLADASYLDSGTTLDPKGKYTINGDPTADMIVVPELVYTGEALDTSGIKIDDSKTGTGTYFGQTFTVKVSAEGWVLQELGEVKAAGEYTAVFKKGEKEISKTFTVAQSGTDLTSEGKVLTYNGDTLTTSFSAGDTITVKATPTAIGTAPQKAAARLRSDYTAPTAGQMALFVGDVQVSEPVQAGEGGTYTMTVSAADVLMLGGVEPNGDPITLTAKFVGNGNMADGQGTAAVNITAVAVAEKGDTVIGYYDESSLAAAFAADSGNAGATFTLLSDVERLFSLKICIDCTLDLNGHTITTGDNLCVSIQENTAVTIRGEGEIISKSIALAVDGSVTLEGGTYTSTGSEEIDHGVAVGPNATLSVTGENVTIRNTGGSSGLIVDAAQSQSVQLSAGKYEGATAAIESIMPLSDMLVHTDNTRYAYYQNDIPVTKASAWVDGNIGDVPLDTPIAWLSDTVTVKACNHAGEGVCTYTHNENTSTHTKTCLACGKTWDVEDCAYTFSGGTGTCAACGDSVTVAVSGTENLVYDGTAKTPGVTVTRGNAELTVGTDYTVAYTDNKNAGENKATVTVTIGNGQGNYIQNFTIGRAALTIKANDQTITYGVSIAAGTDQVTPAGLCTGDTLEGVTLSASSVNVPGGTITPSGAVIKRSGKDVTANYNINYMPGTLTINRAQGTLTVPAGPVAKIFGDGQFLLGCSTNGDGKISYASSDENVASVSADGNVLIKGAGETVITVSLAAGTNYTGAESQEVRITVAKEAAPAIPGETRNYTYLNGSHGAVTIDVAGKLPKDRGETTYTAATTDGKGILSGVSMDQDGNLVYTVEANKAIGDTAVITVTAVMANYEDTAYAVTIKLVEKKTVEPQDGGSVSVKDGCILIYGQTLSDLTLENVIFVEQGTQKQVEGTLAWNDPSHVPEVADRTAQWVFTPKDNKEYEQLTGTAAITVVKATPETEAPEAAAVTYHPAGTLGSVGLNGGGAAWTVGGSAVTVEGTWGWKEPSAIPAVKNSGYTAVFTPEDTANYDTVERTVAVTVAKAEPYIATPPTAAQITYGDALDASALTGGTVQYSSSDGTAVTGSFAWKDGSIKPDSGSAAYTVVFTPADSTDYSSVETQVTLVTGKAENAPDMPPSAMNVARRFEKVGDVGLPEGWQWQDTDRDTALEIGVPVTATAVYTGADRDNYRNVTVSVAITRADCDHEHTEIRNAVTATCQRKGYTGDTWCLDCGELLAKGTETDLADHSGGTATCIRGKVCQVCGTEYTGKDSANHMHTEIRGAIKAGCTSDGYTGDTYCTDCGAKTGSGRAVPAAGHDWHVTREEAATTTSEGRRIYTCGECGQTREESIPKLPQPSHTHSYSPRETKAATCTENGVITYSCSCGDSYTQNTAALGHSYRSGVTKQPTVSAEGVMTYTCGRCGHSYTRPIAKLPDTGTQQPGTQQPGDTEPGSGSTEETRPDTGIPFIKGEDGKTGWDVIRAEEEKAQEGSTINVDMNGTTVVPGDIFDSIRGRDITVTFDMGGGILWSVNGKEVITDKAGDIDFSVKTETNAIPVDIVNNVTGERYSIQISLAHEGEFGFTAVLSIGLGRENAGYTASLYYYNENTGELEFICSDEVAEDGTVSLAFTHASDYVIAIDGDGEEESGNAAEPAQPDTPDKDSTGASEESPQNGQAWRPWWFIVVGALVIVMGIGVFLAVRKKQEDD